VRGLGFRVKGSGFRIKRRWHMLAHGNRAAEVKPAKLRIKYRRLINHTKHNLCQLAPEDTVSQTNYPYIT
jgi:hypothetical protein